MSGETMRCGHPSTPDNLRSDGMRGHRCGICRRERERKLREATPRQTRHIEYRLQYLPRQLAATRKKLAMLENEARRYGLNPENF